MDRLRQQIVSLKRCLNAERTMSARQIEMALNVRMSFTLACQYVVYPAYSIHRNNRNRSKWSETTPTGR